MTRLILRPLLLGAALLGAQPIFAQSVTITGNNGGTVQSNRDCTRSAGQANCTKNATMTGANGQTATRSRTRLTGNGSSSTTITGTGPNGQSNTRTRLLTVTR
jgi:hypothetical protein